MMSSPIKRITHQYKVSLIWIAALFISSLFLFASLLWESADTINQEDEKHVHSSIEEDIQRTKRLLLNNVRDYAIWDSAYDQWIKQQQPDRDWVVSNLGTGLYENLNVEWAAVVSQSQGIRFSAYQGKTHSTVMSQKLAPLTQALLRQGSDLLLLDNKVYAVASHPILKESDNHDAAGYGESFVFATPLNTAEQHELKTHIGYQDLYFSLQPPPSHAYYSLQDNQGKQLGYLNRQPMKPGNQFLHHLFPGFCCY
ncbi:CHASE4 domain-containing protein [Oceanospirillum beijerinckii]|uniref:CHASE4 domain-containing protein n=1 Tax=Oceanospirillum beijerinckii TaxID=64976 RepID=UPI0003F54D38|nr:CHASE4 domain-containing protein [Oceanospirillum beijerinckii]